MEDQLLNQGLTLMIAGMGTVFAFLTALVGAMSVMSRVILRFSPRIDSTDSAGPSAEEVAAITAAVAHHQQK